MVLIGAGMSHKEADRVLDSNHALLDVLKARMDW
jgi:hypothetical protein